MRAILKNYILKIIKTIHRRTEMTGLVFEMEKRMASLNEMIAARGTEEHTIIDENGQKITKKQFSGEEWDRLVVDKAEEHFGSIEHFYEAYQDYVLLIFRDLKYASLSDTENLTSLKNSSAVAITAENVWINYLWAETPPPEDNILQNTELLDYIHSTMNQIFDTLTSIQNDYRTAYMETYEITKSLVLKPQI